MPGCSRARGGTRQGPGHRVSELPAHMGLVGAPSLPAGPRTPSHCSPCSRAPPRCPPVSSACAHGRPHRKLPPSLRPHYSRTCPARAASPLPTWHLRATSGCACLGASATAPPRGSWHVAHGRQLSFEAPACPQKRPWAAPQGQQKPVPEPSKPVQRIPVALRRLPGTPLPAAPAHPGPGARPVGWGHETHLVPVEVVGLPGELLLRQGPPRQLQHQDQHGQQPAWPHPGPPPSCPLDATLKCPSPPALRGCPASLQPQASLVGQWRGGSLGPSLPARRASPTLGPRSGTAAVPGCPKDGDHDVPQVNSWASGHHMSPRAIVPGREAPGPPVLAPQGERQRSERVIESPNRDESEGREDGAQMVPALTRGLPSRCP